MKRTSIKRRHKTHPEPYEEFDGGRQVCGPIEYKRRLGLMIMRQAGRCAICWKPVHILEFDHEVGRGMNGAHRDDRIWKEIAPVVAVSVNPDPRDTWRNSALCHICNSVKGSKRYEWRDGVYQPAEICGSCKAVADREDE